MFTQPETKYYQWKKYRCAYREYNINPDYDSLPLVLLHPVGVGLSGLFWHRFLAKITTKLPQQPIYNFELLGCGECDLPRIAYDPKDWASQLKFFLENVVKKPVILVVQGASFPVAIYTGAGDLKCDLIKGMVLSGPPAWNIMTKGNNRNISDIVWNIFFDSLIGNFFYKYARQRKFIKSFSEKELFANAGQVDEEWLDMLEKDGFEMKKRYGVFSFLAGFWRKDYTKLMKQMDQKILLVMGDQATSVSKEGYQEKPEKRVELYQQNLPNLKGKIIDGRNVLPYESTDNFVEEVINFINNCFIIS